MADTVVKSTQGGAPAFATDDPQLQTAVDHLRRMRYFRRQYDQRRALFYRQYLGQRDQRYFPDNLTPRSNTFVPYPFSNTEEVVSRVHDAYFGFSPWFEAKGRSPQDDDSAEAMGICLHSQLKRARFIDAFEQLVRNICIYGHSGIKVDWDWDFDTITYAEPIFAINKETGQPLMTPVQGPDGQVVAQQPVIMGYRPATKQVPRNRPKFTVIDVYDLLIDPDGGVVAHLTERTLGQLLREQQNSVLAAQQDPAQVKRPLYDQAQLDILTQKVVAASKKSDPMAVIIRMAELWDEFANTQTILTFGEDKEAISWKDLRASYRSATYSPYKREVYEGPPIRLYHGENPFNHKKAPILYTSYIKLPNEVYGLGLVEVISDLSEALNRFSNMISDNWNMGINHRYAYDTNADIDHEALNSFNIPGGKVAVSGDPSKTLFPLPFFTPNQGDYTILPLYKQMIEVASGVSDFYSKGVGSPTNNKTATGINQVINESSNRFKLFIRNLELDILQPLLGMCASLIQQFMDGNIEVQITGNPPAIKNYMQLSPEDLIGTFDFELVAANYATNKVVRQRTLLELVNLLGQSPYINQYEALKELFKVFEIHNSGKILYTPEQVGMMQQQQMQQEVDMMIFQAMLDTESKARQAQSKPQAVGGGQGAGGGRPRKFTIPKPTGAGLQGPIREFAQRMGSNALGTLGNSRNRR